MFLSNFKSYLIKKLFTSTIYFARTNPRAIIPTKREEDGAFDIYALTDKPHEDIIIEPNQIVTVRTGIASAFSPLFRFNAARERSSSGSQGIGLRCGQIDSGYRGEWFLKLQSTTDKRIIITETVDVVGFDKEHNTIYWPMKKAVAQAAFEFSVPVQTDVVDIDKLSEIPSERGMGKLGSSGK
jgi:dUTP pyrophosphatase